MRLVRDRPRRRGAARSTTPVAVAAAVLLASGASITSIAQPSAGVALERGSARSLSTPGESQTSSEGVEVTTFGTITVRPYQSAAEAPVVMALHGVQRVDGATIVYFSAGTSDDPTTVAGLNELASPVDGGYTSGGSIASVRLVDVSGGKVYRTVVLPSSLDSFVTTPFGSDQEAFPGEPGVMGVMYAVLPELPASVEQVQVDLLWGVTIPDVPVADGYLEPASSPDEVIPLGTGWPSIDADEISAMASPEEWIHPLSTVTEALDDSQVVTEEEETVTIDLSADVLFAFDQADLSPAAMAKIAEITEKLVDDGAKGEVSLVGHTDSEGSDAYNLDLSLRRAQSVAAALEPGLSASGVTFTIDGAGESAPVAENSTVEGRQANRRVTITYAKGEGQ